MYGNVSSRKHIQLKNIAAVSSCSRKNRNKKNSIEFSEIDSNPSEKEEMEGDRSKDDVWFTEDTYKRILIDDSNMLCH